MTDLLRRSNPLDLHRHAAGDPPRRPRGDVRHLGGVAAGLSEAMARLGARTWAIKGASAGMGAHLSWLVLLDERLGRPCGPDAH